MFIASHCQGISQDQYQHAINSENPLSWDCKKSRAIALDGIFIIDKTDDSHLPLKG